MKAAAVKKLDPAAPLADNARRIVAVRAHEFAALADRAVASGDAEPLHAARIAAKRLRYVLEVAGFCLGPAAGRLHDFARDTQDLIGLIHDCDVMLPRIESHGESLRREDAVALRETLSSGAAAEDVAWKDLNRAPNRRAYAGLAKLMAVTEARRELLYDRFLRSWNGDSRAEFDDNLRMITETE